MKPSQDYFKALGITREFHEKRKLYTGRFIRFYANNIKKVIDDLGCKTLLDYGCGKGLQWETDFLPDSSGFALEGEKGVKLANWLGVKVTKYDPGVREFSRLPKHKFDIVICTQVLGAIPYADIPYAVDMMFRLADKAVYIGEAGGATKKRVFRQMLDVLPGQWGAEDYREAIAGVAANYPDVQCWFRWRANKVAQRLCV